MNKKLIFDCHTHFNDASYAEQGYTTQQIIAEAKLAGVGYFLNCAFDVPSSKLAIEQANENENVYVAVGIHPNDVSSNGDSAFDEIRELAKDPKVVAIGEVGIDYFYQSEDKENQKKRFKEQIEIAIENDLTLMMHIRDEKDVYNAYDDVIEILKQTKPKRMIVHCFSANVEYAKKFVELGCYINIGGAVTFKNAITLQEAATWIPLDRLLVETDAPYLTPHPHRGEMNFSKYITLTVQKLAELKNVSFEEVVESTTMNAFEVFKIKE